MKTHVIKSLEFKRSMLFHSNFPYVSSTFFDNRTQCLIDFENCMYVINFFCELGFVEWLSCIKLFHVNEFDLAFNVIYAGYTCIT